MANDNIDMMDDDSADELESSGMHVISGEGAEDIESDDEGTKAPVPEEEEETPKDGLAELEELEKKLEDRDSGYEVDEM